MLRFQRSMIATLKCAIHMWNGIQPDYLRNEVRNAECEPHPLYIPLNCDALCYCGTASIQIFVIVQRESTALLTSDHG